MTRIFHPGDWSCEAQLNLTAEASHHLARVLRKRVGDELTLFNGQGLVAVSTIISLDKRQVIVTIDAIVPVDKANIESDFCLHLYQALSKGERFELVIQKAVELGVTTITPMLTERTVVRLDDKRLAKKQQQWQKMIISACEQCGRNSLPLINEPITFSQAIAKDVKNKIILHPHHSNEVELNKIEDEINLYIGPEGGFCESEVALAIDNQALTWQLGPRILRTETAAITALAILQHQLGDLQ